MAGRTRTRVNGNGNGAASAVAEVPAPGEPPVTPDETMLGAPYSVRVTIEGVAPLLMHRWSQKSTDPEKPRGSKAAKTDDVDSYVARDERGRICLPGDYLYQSVIQAAKFKRDPRSARPKQACDLYRAGFVPLMELAPITSVVGQVAKVWDYLDDRRAVNPSTRGGINRVRPAFLVGWKVTQDFEILLSEYITKEEFYDAVSTAGKYVGVGDFRPRFGRFIITEFKVL